MAASSSSATDVEAVDRVLLRLSMATEESLPGILSRLLPSLLGMLTPAASVPLRSKLLECLGHINKRVKDRPSIPLPFAELIGMLAQPTTAPFTGTFVLVYARLAFDRLAPEAQLAALPALLRITSFPAGSVRDSVLGFAIRCLRHVRAIPVDPAARAAMFPFLDSARPESGAECDAFCEFLLDAMLFLRPSPAAGAGAAAAAAAGGMQTNPMQRPLSLGPGQPATVTSMARAVVQQMQAGAGSGGPAGPEPYAPSPGLSLRAAARMCGADQATPEAVAQALHGSPGSPGVPSVPLTGEELTQRKRDVLRLILAEVVPPHHALLLAMAGSVVGGHHEVVEGCEAALKRIIATSSSSSSSPSSSSASGSSLLGGPISDIASVGRALGGDDAVPPPSSGPSASSSSSYGGLLEDPQVVARLFALCLGTPAAPAQAAGAPAGGAAPPVDADARVPLSPAMKAVVVGYLTRSRAAATSFPGVVRLVFDCLFGPGATLRLQGLGVQMAVLCFQLSQASALQPLAPLFLQALLRLLSAYQPESEQAVMEVDGEGEGGGAAQRGSGAASAMQHVASAIAAAGGGLNALAMLDASRVQQAAREARLEASRAAVLAARDAGERQRLREAAYSALGALAAKAPGSFSSSLNVPKLLFARLAAEDVNMRLAVGEALSTLAAVYAAQSGGGLGRVAGTGAPSPPVAGGGISLALRGEAHELLAAYVDHSESRVRQAVAHWAVTVFPFDDPRARYTCVRLAGDPRSEVREAALKGLSVTAARRRAATTATSSATASQSAAVFSDSAGAAASDEADAAVMADADEVAVLSAALSYPRFADMLAFLTAKPSAEAGTASGPGVGPRLSQLAPLPLCALLEFTHTCLEASATVAGETTGAHIAQLDAAGAGSEGDVSMTSSDSPATSSAALHGYLSIIEHALSVSPAAAEAARVHETAASCLARLAAPAPSALCAAYAARLPWLLTWLKHTNKSIRRSFAVVLGAATTALPLDAFDTGSGDAATPASSTVLAVVRSLVTATQDASARGVDGVHGALSALGHVMQRALPRLAARGPQLQSELRGDSESESDVRFTHDTLSSATAAIIAHLPHRLELVREAATSALATVARLGPLPLPGGEGDVAAARAALGAPSLVTGAQVAPDAASAIADAPLPPAASAAAVGSSRADIVVQLARLAVGQVTLGQVTGATAAAASADAKPAAGKAKGVAFADGKDGEGGEEEGSGAANTAATEAAAVCLGAIVSGELAAAAAGGYYTDDDEPLPPLADLALCALLGLSLNRSEAVQFTVGQALLEASCGRAATFGGGASAKGIIGGGGGGDASPTSVSGSSSSDVDLFADNAADNDASAGARAARGSMTESEIALREAATDAILASAMARPLQSIKPQERVAAGVWLLTLTHGLGSVSPALQARLPQLQSAFSRLLGDRSQLAQEAAAKGLALVHECAGPELRAQLVAGLLQGFNTGRKVTTAALPSAPAAASAGATAGVGPGPAGLALSAGGEGSFKELCSMANEAGNPELIYQFLSLSSHHSSWHARGGAAHGLQALLSSRARKALEPHAARLIPKLFRYTYDPSQKVRDAMTDLWRALVRDPKTAVATHIGPILRELVSASSGEHWREREAACLALSDVLHGGRSAGEVRPHLTSLWRAALRSIDDVKDSVREAGLLALKALGKLTLRLCDPSLSGAREGGEVVREVLPFLLCEGVVSPIKDAQAQCVGYLREVAKSAGPLLRPHLPELLGTCLSLLSPLESEKIAYLQTHLDAGTGFFGQGLSGEALEGARIAATRSGPLGDVIDRAMGQLRDMTPAEIAACVPLAAAPAGGAEAKPSTGAGAGASSTPMEVEGEGGYGDADAEAAPAPAKKRKAGGDPDAPPTLLPAICDRLKGLIRSGVGLPSRGATARLVCSLATSVGALLTPQAAGLLKTLMSVLEDPSPTLRREFAVAAAHVARYAKPVSQAKLVARIAELARHPDDPGARATAGVAVAALGKHAGDASKEHAPELVPLAFLGLHDSDAAARASWGEAWEAMAASTESALRLYAPEVVGAIAACLDHSGWPIKRQGAEALGAMVRHLTRASDFKAAAAAGGATSSSGGGGDALLPVLAPGDLRAGPACLPAAVAAAVTAGSPAPNAAVAAGRHASECLTQHSRLLQLSPCTELLPHAPLLVPKLLTALPGRMWEGKEALASALALLASRTAPAFAAPERVAPSLAGGGEGSTPAAIATVNGKLSAEAVIRCLASQAARSNVPVPFSTACASGLALVCRAFPHCDSYEMLAGALSPVLARVGRAVALSPIVQTPSSSAAANPTSSPLAPSGSSGASTSLVGGKYDEGAEGVARAAAKEKDAEAGGLACACIAALAAAMPAVVVRRDAPLETPPVPAPQLLSQVLAPFSIFAASLPPPVLPEELAAATACLVTVSPAAAETQAGLCPPLLQSLSALLDNAGTHTERVALMTSIGAVLAKLSLPALAAIGALAALEPTLSACLTSVAVTVTREDKFSTVRVTGLQALLLAAQVAGSSGAPGGLPVARGCVDAIAGAARKHREGSDAAAAQAARQLEAAMAALAL